MDILANDSPKEHAKNFKTWEVLAIQDDRKTQFREVIKPQPEYNPCADMFTYYSMAIDTNFACQSGDRTGIFGKYVIGDRLWVRETFQYRFDDPGNIAYKADFVAMGKDKLAEKIIWKPSIFMPRSACRILLEVTDVRIERLVTLCHNDVIAEGFSSIELFQDAWNDLYKKRGYEWQTNPWVWSLEFQKVSS